MKNVRHRRLPAALAGLLGLALAAGTLAAPAQADTTYVDEPGGERVTYASSDPDDPADAWATYLRLMTIPSRANDFKPVSKAPGPGTGACPPRRCRDISVPVPAGVKVDSNKARVILPVGYFAKKNRTRRYPVVYLFNGALSPYTRWSESTQIVKTAEPLQVILVMPEGGRNEFAGFFTDWHDGTFQWESFHIRGVLPTIDRLYRTVPGARVSVGASMGALGALIYPARHPGAFQSALSISGFVDTNQAVANALPEPLGQLIGASQPNLTRVWGSPLLQRANWAAHNPVELAPQLRDVSLFIASGTGSPDQSAETGAVINSPYTEQLLWTGHRTFLAALTAAGVGYEARIREGGGHYWWHFEEPLRWGLPQAVSAALAKSGYVYVPPATTKASPKKKSAPKKNKKGKKKAKKRAKK